MNNQTSLKYIKLTLDKVFEKTYQDEFKKIKRNTEKYTHKWIIEEKNVSYKFI